MCKVYHFILLKPNFVLLGAYNYIAQMQSYLSFFFAEIQSFLFENLLYLKRTEFAAVLKLTHEKTGGAQASTPDRGQEALHEVMVLSEAAKS